MIGRIKGQLSAPLVISLIAVFLALGGVAGALGLHTVNAAKNTFGASVNAAGQVTRATALGATTATKTGSNTYTVTFPYLVYGCVPVASTTTGGGDAHATIAGSSQLHQVNVTTTDGSQDFNLIVTCNLAVRAGKFVPSP